MKKECERAFDLLSARTDGEVGQEEEKWLEKHLADCPDCREYETFLASLDRQLHEGVPVLKSENLFLEKKWTRRLAVFLVPAACLVLGFALGATWQGSGDPVAMSSRVAAPTAWIQAAEPGKKEAAAAAAPVAERIEWYQAAIAEELSRESVDWMKIRALVESVNSWRTEIELLTIHAFYSEQVLSRGTGNEGEEWLALLGGSRK